MIDQTLLQALSQAYTQKAWTQVQPLLSQAILQLAQSALCMDSALESQAQAIYQIGAFSAVASKDQAAFDRFMNLLFPAYFDPSKKTALEGEAHVLLGLYLLSLLVRNQIAEFHVTLEQINAAPGIDASNAYIQFPVQLQQCLVEGTYHRVVLARQQVPSPDYAWFIDALMDTIRYSKLHISDYTFRNELANCLEKSFKTIELSSAARLLLLTPEQAPQLAKFAEQRGWHVQNGSTIIFPSTKAQTTDLPTCTRSLIIQSMSYARELEEII